MSWTFLSGFVRADTTDYLKLFFSDVVKYDNTVIIYDLAVNYLLRRKASDNLTLKASEEVEPLRKTL